MIGNFDNDSQKIIYLVFSLMCVSYYNFYLRKNMSDYTYSVRKQISEFTIKNQRKPKFLIVSGEELNKLQDEPDYVYEFMLAKRGGGDHFYGLKVCTVAHGTDYMFQVA